MFLFTLPARTFISTIVEMNVLCSVCFSEIAKDDALLIRDIPKDVLNVLLIKFELEESSDHAFCNVCYKSLLAAFEFKSTCMRVDVAIAPYIDWKNPTGLDLRDVYLKEIENKHAVMLSKDEKICRFCMKLAGETSVSLREMDVDWLEKLLPEINLNVIKDPVVCKSCTDSFVTHCSFFKNSLDILLRNSGPLDSDKSLIESFIKTEEIDIKPFDELEQNKMGTEENGQMRVEADNVTKATENNQNSGKPRRQTNKIKYEVCSKNNRVIQKMYKCDTCDYETKTKRGLREHQLKHMDPSKVQWFKCDICKYETKIKHYLNRHLLVHKDPSQMEMYKCDSCDYKTKFKKYLKKHQLKHKDPSEVELYKCDICEYKTKLKHYLKYHQLIHKDPSQVEMYRCDSCEYKTKLRKYLRRHQLVHKNPLKVQMYKCDSCEYETNIKHYLKGHEVIHKGLSEVQIYKCNFCDYETKVKRYLTYHLLVHKDPSQMETYKCATCDFETSLKRYLTRHQLIHKDPSEVQMHKCNFCDYETKYKGYLKEHELKHKDPSEVQMHSCDVCDYKTKYRGDLKRHQLVHADT